MRRVLLPLLLLPVWAAAAAEAEAREVLTRRCLGCHSAELKTGGLDLSTRTAAARVLSNGTLIERVASGKMPPAAPLPPGEVETLREWIAAGAPWTGAPLAPRRAGLDWWSLQPLQAPSPSLGIDHWIGAKLREAGLSAAPPASRRALIRRVTLGLTGLAPAPEEVNAFLADTRPDAYQRLVDRLLASPHYGEHWARHWLDVVRYAESEGFERDWLRDSAWPYRDYVIRSFNADRLYPQFVREQIAGDVQEGATHDSLIATSLLAMGPYDAVGLTSAVERERDQVREDQLEEMLGVVSQTFLGLTVNCARCHNHKFDPIPQTDYYRLKAVFAGVWQPTVGTELKADGREILTADERAARDRQIAALHARIAALSNELGTLDRRNRPADRARAGLVARWTFDSDARDDFGQLHGDFNEAAEFHAGRLRPAAGKDSVTLTTAPLSASIKEKTLEVFLHAAKAPAKAVTFLQIRNRSGFRGAATDGIRFNAGEKKQWVNASTVNFRTEEVGGPKEDTVEGGLIHVAITYAASGEIRIYRNGALYGRAYTPDPNLPQGATQTYLEHDAVLSLTSTQELELEEARFWGRALSADEIAESFRTPIVNHAVPATEERGQLARELAETREQLRKLPQPPKAFSAQPSTPASTHLLIRGDVSRKGDLLTPAAPSCLRGHPGDLALMPDSPDAARRRALADWIANDANALFWRVMANRVWHYHFGAGFVDSPNDFGYNGGQPSHPELLDAVAAEFRRTGGSLKSLHRTILLSDAYQRSTRFDSAAAAKDASARLLWRFPLRRLNGETVRDAMLQSAGIMNTEMYGPSFRPFQIVKNSGSYHSYDPVDSAAPELQRRTVYRMNVNSGGNPMLDALDCPLPSVKTPKRSITTTPLQALSLMNNPFVTRMAKQLAARVIAERDTTAGRVERTFELVLSRPPREEEAASSEALVNASGLEALCWGLFNTSEFLYAP
ncbi:MAG: DUF1549 domain-containing protein [Acidobacteria bacterium]|nr:DUF1549 domain-containing protein [Acidobacteriota bacterium]